MKSLPEHLDFIKKTPLFNKVTTPGGLMKNHSTGPGVWGKIIVEKGQLLLRIMNQGYEEVLLDQHQFGVVEPQVQNEILPVGDVEFYVEFYRQKN
ncbi:MAG: DUF1971 domain-containing protein [Lentisphaeria bacterium]|nr:DUF1971 domain-containing protein [Lentisphaeria bacterium]